MASNVWEIIGAISKVESREELQQINEALRQKFHDLRDARNKEAALKLGVGAEVTFKARHGLTIRGTVTGFNRKTVKVRETDGLRREWRVSPTLLRPV